MRRTRPLSRTDLTALVEYLNRPGAPPCDNTLGRTIRFLETQGLPVARTVAWLKANGGFCDCEVVWNVDPWGDRGV